MKMRKRVIRKCKKSNCKNVGEKNKFSKKSNIQFNMWITRQCNYKLKAILGILRLTFISLWNTMKDNTINFPSEFLLNKKGDRKIAKRF